MRRLGDALRLLSAGLGALMLIELAVIGWLLLDAGHPARRPQRLASQASAASSRTEPVPGWPSLAAAAGSRSLFSAAPSVGLARDPRDAPGRAAAIASPWRVVGVVSGEIPRAIFEHSQTHEVSMAAAGSRLTDGTLVESVGDGRVVVLAGGARVELTWE